MNLGSYQSQQKGDVKKREKKKKKNGRNTKLLDQHGLFLFFFFFSFFFLAHRLFDIHNFNGKSGCYFSIHFTYVCPAGIPMMMGGCEGSKA